MSLRILWVSDSPIANSGYSVETALTVPRLNAMGHPTAVLCTYGLQGGKVNHDGYRLYPGGADPFANDVVQLTAKDWQADVVITLKDTFVFQPQAFQGLRWCPLVPIDHEPAPPAVVERLRHAYRPIAYAPNGVRALRAAGFDPLYAPHAYDEAVYHPVPRSEARRALGVPDDAFIVGVVAVNRGGYPSRKAWPQLLEGFARFSRGIPNARMWAHTWLGQDGFEGAVNIPHLANDLGMGGALMYCDQEKYRGGGFPTDYMRLYYGAIDVLLAVSLGEGFGIPTLEAQACARPVIVGGWAAQEDLCWGGWSLRREDALRFPDAQGANVYIPQPEAIAAALGAAHAALGDPDRRDYYEAAALDGARSLEIGRVMDTYWRPALAELEAQIAREHRRGVVRVVRPEEVLA